MSSTTRSQSVHVNDDPRNETEYERSDSEYVSPASTGILKNDASGKTTKTRNKRR